MYRDHVPCTVYHVPWGHTNKKELHQYTSTSTIYYGYNQFQNMFWSPPEDLFSLPCTTLVPHHGLEVLYNITFRWKGEPLVRRVLEAGIEAMGIAGKPYRIGTVKQVYGVVSIFLGMCF